MSSQKIDPEARPAAAAHDPLPFERLLAELSAGFINLPAARIDDAITDALRRIVGLLDVDRANLVRFVPRTDEAFVTHTWSAEGLTTVVLRSIAGDFPWLVRRIRSGAPVVVERLDDLPPEAKVDAATWRRVGVKSNLTMPLVVGGQIEGALALAALGRERAWPEPLASRMRVLADVFGNALAHKRAQEALDTAVAFERLVSDVLAALLTAPRAERGRVIEGGLADVARLFGAERATLWQRVGEEAAFVKTHRWLAEGVPIPPDSVGSQDTPWITGALLRGVVVRFGSLAALPPEAASDLPGLRRLAIRAAVAVPLSASGRVVGVLTFAMTHADRDWPEALVPRITLLGEVFASVLARDEAERREQEAKAQAAHAARVGAMGAFAASLAHELTQPLAANLANAETGIRLLAAPDPDLDEVRATLADIVADERRAGELAQKLRRFLRRGDVEMGELEVRDVLEEAFRLVAREAEARGVALVFEPVGPLPMVVGDRVQLQQVVLNLLSNAFDAVAAAAPASRRVVVRAGPHRGGVSVEVVDNGVGMDDQIRARLFQPFFTTKSGGMGLGLSISRTIIEAHGGTLSVGSTPGDGTTFRIELPARPPGDPRSAHA